MQTLGIIISPKVKKPTQLYFHLDSYFFYFPSYHRLLCLSNDVMKEVANSYHFDYNPIKTNQEVLNNSDFVFVFGVSCLNELDFSNFKKKMLVIS